MTLLRRVAYLLALMWLDKKVLPMEAWTFDQNELMVKDGTMVRVTVELLDEASAWVEEEKVNEIFTGLAR